MKAKADKILSTASYILVNLIQDGKRDHMSNDELTDIALDMTMKLIEKIPDDQQDEEDDEDVIPEDDLTEDEKRVKRMAEEYDQLTGRLERLQAFRDTDTYKQLPENSRFLLDNQCKAMDDYQTYLKRRIQLECDNTGKAADK